MAQSRRNHGNLKRAEWRHKCRVRLSQHLYERLGITVNPAHVRLKPGPDDPYRWVPLSSKKHLLDKQLSKGSIHDFQEVYAAVDVALEAVPVGEESNELASYCISGLDSTEVHNQDAIQDRTSGSAESFAAKITQLTEENDELRSAEHEWKACAEKSETALQDMLNDLHEAQVKIERLQTEVDDQQEKYHQSLGMVQTFQEAAQNSYQALQAFTKAVDDAKCQLTPPTSEPSRVVVGRPWHSPDLS